MTPPAHSPVGNAVPAEGAPPRLLSLDVFRGATIALMILVNNPGDWSHTWAPLLHAHWHGWTPTDLVFPFFLYIVGVAIPLSLGSRAARGASRRALHVRIVRRSLLLVALGLALAWFPYLELDWSRVRFPGVLQRIGIVYGVTAMLVLHLRPRARIGVAVALLGATWWAMKCLPVPGFPLGDLSPEGNVAFWLDHRIFGDHTWRGAPGPGDPEGLLSTLPAIVTALVGVWTGELLLSARPHAERLRRLALVGAGLALSGWALSPLFPINKNLWSPTYTLFTAGLGALALAATSWWLDPTETRGVPRSARWAEPCRVFGTNSILAFVGSGVLARLLTRVVRWTGAEGEVVTAQGWLYGNFYAPHLPPEWASFAWALTNVAVWLGVLWVLDRKKLYWKI